jgi:hypothetical protein
MDAHKVDHGPVLLPIPASALDVSVCFAINDPREFGVYALGAALAGGQLHEDCTGRVVRWTGQGIIDTGVEYTVVGPPEQVTA